MFEFLFDNPWLFFIIIYWVVTLLVKKKKTATAGSPTREKQSLPPKSPAAGGRSWTKELEEQIRQAFDPDAVAAATARGSSATKVVLPPKPKAAQTQRPKEVSASKPTSTLSQGFKSADRGRVAGSIESGQPEKIRDDTSRIDYDLNSAPFTYHQTIEEPVEQEYHLKGFTGFHEAHGLERTPEVFAYREEHHEIHSLFTDADDIRRAIIMVEVLGPPLSSRSRRGQLRGH